jgi:hypothetical protein
MPGWRSASASPGWRLTVVAGSPEISRFLVTNRLVFVSLMIAEVGLVFYLSARVDRLAPTTAAGLFAL